MYNLSNMQDCSTFLARLSTAGSNKVKIFFLSLNILHVNKIFDFSKDVDAPLSPVSLLVGHPVTKKPNVGMLGVVI